MDARPPGALQVPSISSYPLQFPFTSRVTTTLHCIHRLRFTLHVLDFARTRWHIDGLPRPADHGFWHTVFDSEQNFWLWENEDEHELEHRFVREFVADRHIGLSANAIDDVLAHKLQDCSERTSGIGRLAHLKSGVRIQFLAWLFIVVERFGHDGMAISVCETIRTWSQIFRYYPTISHDAQCGCDASALKDWVNVMLQVYSVADLTLMPWGSSCNCLTAELGRQFPIALATNGGERCPALYRLLFKIFVPAWPSVLWVLFRMLRTDEQDPVPTFLSILRRDEYRDLFVWNIKDQQALASSQQNLGMASLILDWHGYISEIDSQTWGMISSMTRVESPSSIHHDAPLRICGWTLMLSNSLDVPQTVAEAFNIDIASEYWVQFSNIASPAYAKEPDPLSYSPIAVEELAEDHSTQPLFRHIARVTIHYVGTGTVHLISLILNNHEPLFAFYPATRCTSYHSLEWLTSTRYAEGNPFFTVLLFRSDFQALLDILKVEIQRYKHKIVATHTWAVDFHSHAVQCLIYLTARLVDSLQNRDVYDVFLKHRGTDAQHLLDLLQDLLDLEAFSVTRPMLFKAMCRLSRASNLYPRCFTLTGLHKVGTQVAGGGYGDIWKGLVRGQSVCVKILRIFQEGDIAMAVKDFGAEALIWRQLCHPNVLPFFGLYYIEQRLCLISPWMQNGNIMEYVRVNSPDIRRRFSMILDVASGLEYLHAQATVHGDLKGINILVTPSGRACIADFGLSIIVNAMTLRVTTSTIANRGGTARYHAPELFRETGVKTFASDIYAFGCVAYEIITGAIPFRELSNDMNIMFRVLDGKRPEQLPSCTGTPALDSVWELLQMCWDGEQQKRPKADEIIKRLSQAPITAATTPMESDWDDQFTAKFRRSINMQPLLPSVNQLERMIFGEEVAKEQFARQSFGGKLFFHFAFIAQGKKLEKIMGGNIKLKL
ncbi:kinase domain-containing protein [Favolaschia claudopus]|uniref:Kinase domain-containing protein n=1 Tax=Favolaschia claudopus TaxID=2862362 RepID=A0AAW0BJT2_9AGAR